MSSPSSFYGKKSKTAAKKRRRAEYVADEEIDLTADSPKSGAQESPRGNKRRVTASAQKKTDRECSEKADAAFAAKLLEEDQRELERASSGSGGSRAVDDEALARQLQMADRESAYGGHHGGGSLPRRGGRSSAMRDAQEAVEREEKEVKKVEALQTREVVEEQDSEYLEGVSGSEIC